MGLSGVRPAVSDTGNRQPVENRGAPLALRCEEPQTDGVQECRVDRNQPPNASRPAARASVLELPPAAAAGVRASQAQPQRAGEPQPSPAPVVSTTSQPGQAPGVTGEHINTAIAGSFSEAALRSGTADGVTIVQPGEREAIRGLSASILRTNSTYERLNSVREAFNKKFGTAYTNEQLAELLGAARYSLERGGQALPDGRRVYASLTQEGWLALATHAVRLAHERGLLKTADGKAVNVDEALAFVKTSLTSNVRENLRRSGKADTLANVAAAVERARAGLRASGVEQRVAQLRGRTGVDWGGATAAERRASLKASYEYTAKVWASDGGGAPVASSGWSGGPVVNAGTSPESAARLQQRAAQLLAEQRASFGRAIGQADDRDHYARRSRTRLALQIRENNRAEAEADEAPEGMPRAVRPRQA